MHNDLHLCGRPCTLTPMRTGSPSPAWVARWLNLEHEQCHVANRPGPWRARFAGPLVLDLDRLAAKSGSRAQAVRDALDYMATEARAHVHGGKDSPALAPGLCDPLSSEEHVMVTLTPGDLDRERLALVGATLAAVNNSPRPLSLAALLRVVVKRASEAAAA